MRNGTPTSFVKVPVLAENGLITKTYLHDIEAAITQRTPIAGQNITIKVSDGSYIISATGGIATSTTDNLKEYFVTVCSNGVPTRVVLYGR